MTREPAWRIFAREFNDSIVLEKKGEEKEANYILTRLGAKINRILVVGIMENRNILNENSFITGTVNDLTGTIHFSADKNYSNPSVWKFLTSRDPPVRIALVGKVRTYGESKNLDLRIENIAEVDELMEEYWKLTAIRNLLYRINIIRELQNSTDKGTLEKLGFPKTYIESSSLAIELFKDLNIDFYLTMVKELIGMKVEEKNENIDPEKSILDLVEKLDFDGKGARYDDIMENALKFNFERSQVDEILNSLLDKGLIYEPSVNYFKIS
ncbi:MAG: hypothetical protein ACP5F1_00250 [Thermoplasmata archaeon]|nr:hypothetical protein [Thermoplasmata archaeon]